MSDPKVGEYLGKYFVAVHQQVGDFKVTNVRGKIKRNGGNVVSYFCTPEGRVIHAVVGPVKPEELLKEARWAVETYRAGVAAVGRSRVKLTRYIENAHAAELNTTPDALRYEAQKRYPDALSRYRNELKNRKQDPLRYLEKGPLTSPAILARRRAAKRFGHDRVHQLLAAQPLPWVKDLYREVFEKLAGEKVSGHRGLVVVAARKLQYAAKKRLPVLLLLYDGVGRDDRISSSTQRQIEKLFRDLRVAKVLRKWYVVSLPIDQLPALTQLADVPSYEMKGRSDPILILTDHSGHQLDSIAGLPKSEELADKLWQGLVRQRRVAADEMAAAGKRDAAVEMLRGMLTEPIDSASRQVIQERIRGLERPMVEHAIGQTLALAKSQER